MDRNKNIMPRIRISPWDVLKGIGGAACELFKMHQLSQVSEHKFDHPFDHELYDLPVSQVDALNNMNQVYFPEETGS